MSVTCVSVPAHNLHLFHDQAAQPAPSEYRVFLNGLDSVVTAAEGEDSRALWERVLAHLSERRLSLVRQRSLLPADALASVYAGELTDESLEALRVRHMREFIISGLTAEASNRKDGDGRSRVDALRILASIHGVTKPTRTRRTHTPAAMVASPE